MQYLQSKYPVMNFAHFINQTLGPMGFDLVTRYQVTCGDYNHDTGWPLNLPVTEFTPKTLVILHFTDFITFRDGRWLELEVIERFYGEHCGQVLITYWTADLDQHYHGPLNLIKFSNHNYDLCNALAAGFADWQHILTQPRTHAWQCLNGRICVNRSRVAHTLKNWDNTNGWLSLGTEIPLPEFDYNNYFGCDNYPNFLKLGYVYGSAAVNIVTETEYFTVTGIVTEKTLLAFAAEQIPIVIGHPGIVEHCRRMGFDMFDDLVDNSYDNISNDMGLERADQALIRNRDLIQGQIDLAPYRARLERNREWALWGLPDRMERDFVVRARALADQLLPGYGP
jgi:hypothetical protein